MGITVALGAGLGGEDGKLGIEINPTELTDGLLDTDTLGTFDILTEPSYVESFRRLALRACK